MSRNFFSDPPKNRSTFPICVGMQQAVDQTNGLQWITELLPEYFIKIPEERFSSPL